MAKPSCLYLGLGSNRGDSVAILRGAARMLSARLGEAESSAIYSSRPMYVLDQPPFLNCVLRTELPQDDPESVLDFCQSVEAAWGRDRSRERPKGERSLDVDILLWGSLTVSTARLRLPHPGLTERKFALLPLLELDPRLERPDGGGSYADCLDALPEQGIYYASLADYASIVP